MKYTQQQQLQGAELLKSLVEKAWENPEFKNQLIKEPKKVLETVTGQKIAEDAKVVVEDQSNSDYVYFNIPRKVNVDNFELSDEQLEIISGGETVILGACAVLTLVGASFAFGYTIGKDLATK